MACKKIPSRHLYRAYIASVIITATAALYCLVMLILFNVGMYVDHVTETLRYLFLGFLFFNFPGITTLILANDYLNRTNRSQDFRSMTVEVIGIAACPHTLVVSAFFFNVTSVVSRTPV